MNEKYILEKMKENYYWDSRITSLSCNHLADELTLTHEDNVRYTFLGCYKIEFYHDVKYKKDKNYSELTIGQIPYFMENVTVEVVIENGCELYKTVIEAPPMELNILSRDILVTVE